VDVPMLRLDGSKFAVKADDSRFGIEFWNRLRALGREIKLDGEKFDFELFLKQAPSPVPLKDKWTRGFMLRSRLDVTSFARRAWPPACLLGIMVAGIFSL